MPNPATCAALALALTLGTAGFAQDYYPTEAPTGDLPPPIGELVPLLDYIPGVGTLYVDPEAPKAGPFAAYDKAGTLVSTIYMIPISDIAAQEKFDDLQVHGDDVLNVELYFNPGHHGFAEPHYHIVLWHVDPETANLE